MGARVTTGLYLSDSQIRQKLGIAEKRWRLIKGQLERDGLPMPDALVGKRYWPAVEAWLSRRHGIDDTVPVSPVQAMENWDALKKRRAGA